MNYYLDTNICIFFLKGMHPNLLREFKSHTPKIIKIPDIVIAELIYGAHKSAKKSQNIEQIEKFLLPFESVPFDKVAAYAYGEVRTSLEKARQIIGPNDLIIASTVLAGNGVLVTNNVKEFSRIPNLAIEDWTNNS